MLYGATDLTRSFLGLNQRTERLRDGEFWAVDDVSFELKKGETLGIIGPNGSGKSTMLKLLNGIFMPDKGKIEINGRVGALIEVGAGFHPMLTGRENIYVNGAILGMSKKEVDKRFEEIVEFADIGDFIDSPVKHYSSGMYVRLGFSIAAHAEPHILLVDEVLAVGDMFFQSKCIVKMKDMIDKGATLLFISHNTGAVKSVCKKSILLNKGKLIDYDKSDKVVAKYFSLKVQSEQYVIKDVAKNNGNSEPLPESSKKGGEIFINNAEFQKRASFQRVQNGKASFANVQLLDENGNEIQSVEYEQNVILRMAFEIHEDMDLLGCGYHIRDKNGVAVVHSGFNIENKILNSVKKGEKYLIDWRYRMSLMHGQYNIACIISIPIDIESAKVDYCDFIPLAVLFEMQPRKGAQLYGFIHWENEVVIEKI